MKRLLVVAALLAMPLARPVFAGPAVPPCCACFVETQPRPAPAVFCVSPMNLAEQITAEERCHDVPDAAFMCSAFDKQQTSGVTPECVDQLRGLGILCPPSRGTPALGRMALVALAGVLGIVGASTLRRRARRA
jgi:hypothetical protein